MANTPLHLIGSVTPKLPDYWRLEYEEEQRQEASLAAPPLKAPDLDTLSRLPGASRKLAAQVREALQEALDGKLDALDAMQRAGRLLGHPRVRRLRVGDAIVGYELRTDGKTTLRYETQSGRPCFVVGVAVP